MSRLIIDKVYLPLFTFLVTITLLVGNSYSDNDDWNTVRVIGKYVISDPPKSDQTFIVYYRVLNGTAEWLGGSDYFVANVASQDLSKLELKICFVA